MKKFFALFVMAVLAAAPAIANEATKSSTTTPAPAKQEAMKASESTTTKSTTSTSSTSSTSSTASAPSAPSATSTSSTPSTASTTTTSSSASKSASSETLPAGLKTLSSAKGEYFATASGLTIYTFAKDEAGKSNCTGACSKMWPALAASSTDKATGQFTIINGNQWAFNGKPLYTYSMDKKAGDLNGASIPGWSVASSTSSIPAEKPAH